MAQNAPDPVLPAIEQLLDVMRALRDPDGGCPWDIAQDFTSIAPYTLEEAYEVVDAIERGDFTELCDELGDLLLQVVFHAQMASEAGLFDFEAVARAIVAKLLRRHPHVFGQLVLTTGEELAVHWEAIKASERRAKDAAAERDGQADSTAPRHESELDGVTLGLPALIRAGKLQRRAARIGFDWPDIDPVYHKVEEELDEVRQAMSRQDGDAVEDEIGDLLFTVVNLARRAGVEPERALRRANRKFERRFRSVELLAIERGLDLRALKLAVLDRLWEEAKQHRV